MRSLAKAWILATSDPTGATAWFDSGYIRNTQWTKQEQTYKEQVKSVPWSIIVGKCGGEDLAKAALARGEIEEIANEGRGPKVMYTFVTLTGALQQRFSNTLNKKVENQF